MRKISLNKIAAGILSTIFVMVFAGSFVSLADSKTIRVGWYESPFNIIDENGRRSGYAYEYEQKIAAYTGWTYEYVEGTWTDLLVMLENGEIDCVFPANLTVYDSEQMGIVMSPTMMSTEMLAVVRMSDQHSFFHKDQVTVAVNAGNPNYDLFLKEQFPDWDSDHFIDTPTCLQEVADGKADCVIVSNYRYNNISELCNKLKLTAVSTGVVMDYSFAIKTGSTVLYSIMAKATAVVPESVTHSALNFYATEDSKVTFGELIREKLGIKKINDQYGHDKGDEYSKNACHFICTTFRRSAVFRIGGDEFAAVLMNEDFANRDSLIDIFVNEQESISSSATDPWNQLHIAIGLAIFTPETDSSLNDTIKRADNLMYVNKRVWKEANAKK